MTTVSSSPFQGDDKKRKHVIIKQMSEQALPYAIPDAEALAFGVPPPEGALTAGQIASRHLLVHLHRQLNEKPYNTEFPFVEEISAMPADEARARLRDEEAKSSSRYPTENMHQYTTYVEDLHLVRTEQQDHIIQALQRIPEDAPDDVKRAAYLDALDHSPPLAAKTMHHLNNVATTVQYREIGRKLFNDTQIAEIATDKPAFEQALVQVVMKEPAIVLGAGNILSKVADAEQIRTALDTLRQTHPHELMTHLDFALPYYSPDQRKEVVLELAKTDPSFILFKLTKPALAELVGEDEVRQLAQQTIEEGPSLPTAHTLKHCIEQGYVSRETVKERIFADLAADPTSGSGYTVSSSDILSAEEREALHDAAYVAYEEADEGRFKDIRKCRLLSQEDVQRLTLERFQANPTVFIDSYPWLLPHIPADALNDKLAECINAGDEQLFKWPKTILDSSLDPAQKRDFSEQLAEAEPQQFIATLSELNGKAGDTLFSAQELAPMVQTALAKVDFGSLSYNLANFIQYTGDPLQQKQYIQTQFATKPNFNVFSMSNNEVMTSLFTTEERLGMLKYAVDQRLEDSAISSYDLAAIRTSFGDADYKDVVDHIRGANLEVFLMAIDEVSYLYPPEELANLIAHASATPEGRNQLLQTISTVGKNWLYYAPESSVLQVMAELSPAEQEIFILLADKISPYISADKMQQTTEAIARANPALCWLYPDYFENYLPNFSTDRILEQALQDDVRMTIAGKYLTQTLQKAHRSTKETARERLLRDASYTYQTLETNRRAGLLDGVAQLHDRLAPDAKGEKTLLEAYDIVVRLGTPEHLAELQGCQSLEAISEYTARVVAQAAGVKENATPEQAKKLLGSLDSVIPLGLYAAQYIKSPGHQAVLQPMTKSLLEGNYETWKFGADTAEHLESFKNAGLLPRGLTLDQYRIWRQESSTEHRESFVVETQAVTGAVRRILSDNQAVLPIDGFIPAEQQNEALLETADRLTELGQEIGQTHQEIKILSSQPDQALAASQVSDLRAALVEATAERRELQVQQDIIQLFRMNEEEVRSGTLRPLNDTSKGRPVAQALQRLKKGLDGNVGYVSTQLQQVFESYNEQTGSVQAIRVVDTASPKRTLEVGDVPVDSCQNYRNGVMNQCLLGYTEPDTKLLFTTNDRGNPVARSVFRLLESADSADGQPALHVETVYSADASDGIPRAMYQHAVQKAQAMGMPVYVSQFSQNAEGDIVETRATPGVQYTPSNETTLRSNRSRAPEVYVDSNGGAQPQGRYTISRLSKITT